MKIKRFINGKRIHNSFNEDIVIENELIVGTIEKINNRIFKQNTKENKKNVND